MTGLGQAKFSPIPLGPPTPLDVFASGLPGAKGDVEVQNLAGEPTVMHYGYVPIYQPMESSDPPGKALIVPLNGDPGAGVAATDAMVAYTEKIFELELDGPPDKPSVKADGEAFLPPMPMGPVNAEPL
jgi:hypothetical protein